MSADPSLIELGHALIQRGFQFTAITPSSHALVLRRSKIGADLRDLLGWSRTVPVNSFEPEIVELLLRAQAAIQNGPRLEPRLRAATLDGRLYFHSVYPTLDEDAVFFGPDTYRTVRWLRRRVEGARRLVDIGAGSGAAGLSLADRVDRVCLCDVNPRALRLSRVNAELAGVLDRTTIVQSDVLASVDGNFDLIVSNPPYLIDPQERAYRHGGGSHGGGLSLRIVAESLERLASGGRLLLYTASAIVDGRDTFFEQVEPLLADGSLLHDYEEIDPDVFGEELATPAYAQADRIAAVGLCVTKR